jgi:hypothetical protein
MGAFDKLDSLLREKKKAKCQSDSLAIWHVVNWIWLGTKVSGT